MTNGIPILHLSRLSRRRLSEMMSSTMKHFPFRLAIFLSLVGASASAATVLVPQDYPTIQGALDASQNGDEVVVSPGTYIVTDSINLGRRILRSTFDGNNWETIKNTIIKTTGGTYINAVVGPLTVRGFTLTRDPVTPGSGQAIRMQGIVGSPTSDATIEYNIIENCVFVGGNTGFPGVGGALYSLTGVIQNNIIRNNRADSGSVMDACGGIIQNNVIYNTNGAFADLSAGGQFVNNTIYSTTTVGASIAGTILNNIFWADGVVHYSALNARYCLIKGYTGSEVTILKDDPLFKDRANGDLHLLKDSPAVDAGVTNSNTPSGDIESTSRHLDAKTVESRGDGSKIDIGAYEFVPPPVAVWLPNGGPAQIHAGDTLAVAWQIDTATAGTAINLQLYDDRSFVAPFGVFVSSTGMAHSQVLLPTSLPTKSTYYIKGTSVVDLRLGGSTPPMTILGANLNDVLSNHWIGYR